MSFDYIDDVETLVVDSLPAAFHSAHLNWRQRAKAFLEAVEARGWKVVPANEKPLALTVVPGFDHDNLTHEVVVRFREPHGIDLSAEWRIAPKDILEIVAALTNNAKYALTSVGVALAVGDCATCGNRRLVYTEKYGHQVAERCPECGRRYNQAVAFEDFPQITGSAKP